MVSAIQTSIPNINRLPSDAASLLDERIRHAIHQSPIFVNARKWQKELDLLSPEDLGRMIEEICQTEGPDAMENLARLLPFKKLNEAVRLRYPNHIDALSAATAMLREAKYYVSRAQIYPTLRTRCLHILHALIDCLESLIYALGIANFFKPKENDLEADFKAQKIMMLLSLFTMLSTLLIPIIGPVLVAWIIGGGILSLSALSLIYPAIRPTPHRLPEGENWTEMLRDGKLQPAAGRKECLDEIARTLIAGKGVKTHPMLIGKTGVGKTEAIKAFVEAVDRGDYPELAGKQVIVFNTASLVQHHEMFNHGNKILKEISEEMGRHRENFILVFDEIHYALMKKETSAIGEQLKTMLDPGNTSFPYVIGITTEEEYYRDIYVNHAAFARRFKPIRVDSAEPHETQAILSNTILQKAPQTILDPDALPYLANETSACFPNLSQPLAAQKILMKCIQATADSQHSPLEKQAEAIKSEIESLTAQAIIASNPDAIQQAILPFEEKLRFIEMNLLREKAEIDRLFQLKDRLAAIKKASMQKVVEAVQDKSERTLSAFLTFQSFQIPLLEAQIRAEAKRIGISAVIDRSLIDRMIADEQANDQKIQQACESGRSDLNARAL